MYFVFDLETTGLPRKASCDSSAQLKPCYEDLEKFKSARIVSIAWLVLDKSHQEVSSEYHVIKPIGYVIPKESTKIHGITHDHAAENGIMLSEVVDRILLVLSKYGCKFIVSHNIQFDRNILLSELYRGNFKSLLCKLSKLKQYCTMQHGKVRMNIKKYPKLGELYGFLTKKEMNNAHNALFDTLHCAECFKYLSPVNAQEKDDVSDCSALPTSGHIETTSSFASPLVVPLVAAVLRMPLVPPVTSA